MKAALPLIASLMAAATLAQAAPIAKITTLTGKTYRQCHIVKVHPDGVSFRHANGAAKVLFTDLSSDWRDRLGYSPSKAAAYKKEQAAKIAADKAARAKYEEARYAALAAAADRARIQALGQEAQARATMLAMQAQQQQMNQNQNAGANGLVTYTGPSVIPVLPALGTVHDTTGIYGRTDRYRTYPYGYNNGYGYAYPYGYGYPGYPYNGSYGIGFGYNRYGASYYHHNHGGWGGNYCRPGGSTFRVTIRR